MLSQVCRYLLYKKKSVVRCLAKTGRSDASMTMNRARACISRGMSDVNCTRYQPGLPVNYLSKGIKSGSAHRGGGPPYGRARCIFLRDPSIPQPKTMDASHHPSPSSRPSPFTLRRLSRTSAIPIRFLFISGRRRRALARHYACRHRRLLPLPSEIPTNILRN